MSFYLEAHVSRDTLVGLLDTLAPLRIHMTPVDEDRRWLELEKPSDVRLVPGRGLVIVTRGKLRFELAAVRIPATIEHIQLLLEPKLTVGSGAGSWLSFNIDIEEADLKFVPNLLDKLLVDQVNAALTPRASKLAWRFDESLSKKLQMPSRLEPLDSLRLSVKEGAVEVTAQALVLRVYYDVAFERSKPRPTDDQRV